METSFFRTISKKSAALRTLWNLSRVGIRSVVRLFRITEPKSNRIQIDKHYSLNFVPTFAPCWEASYTHRQSITRVWVVFGWPPRWNTLYEWTPAGRLLEWQAGRRIRNWAYIQAAMSRCTRTLLLDQEEHYYGENSIEIQLPFRAR